MCERPSHNRETSDFRRLNKGIQRGAAERGVARQTNLWRKILPCRDLPVSRSLGGRRRPATVQERDGIVRASAQTSGWETIGRLCSTVRNTIGIGLVGWKPAFGYLVKAAPCSASVGAAAALAVYIGHVKVYQRMRCSMGSSGVSSRRFLELSTRRLSCATRGA